MTPEKPNVRIVLHHIREGANGQIFARDPIFGGSCVSESLPLKDCPITRVLQVKIKGGQKEQNLGVIKIVPEPEKFG